MISEEEQNKLLSAARNECVLRFGPQTQFEYNIPVLNKSLGMYFHPIILNLYVIFIFHHRFNVSTIL